MAIRAEEKSKIVRQQIKDLSRSAWSSVKLGTVVSARRRSSPGFYGLEKAMALEMAWSFRTTSTGLTTSIWKKTMCAKFCSADFHQIAEATEPGSGVYFRQMHARLGYFEGIVIGRNEE